jgi:hypothetical protein
MFITTEPVAPEATPVVPDPLVDVPPVVLPLPGTKGEVPASPPPPPHADTSVMRSSAAILFNMVISRSVREIVWNQEAQRAADRSVTTFGVRKMSISVLLLVFVFVLNRLPR